MSTLKDVLCLLAIFVAFGKRHQLSKTEVWKEIGHFLELHEAAPDEYVKFALICGDFLDDLQPLIRKLDRLRGPASTLNADSAIRATAETEIIETVIALGSTATLGRFIFERVTFIQYEDTQVDGGFSSLLSKCLPAVSNLRGSEVQAFLARCKQLVQASVKGRITRQMLEAALVDTDSHSAGAWLASPSDVLLLPGPPSEMEPLALDVGRFNGAARGALGTETWAQLQRDVCALATFVQDSRVRRTVRISAKQRMSLACLMGHCFSATRGFFLQMVHNDQVFDTASHERSIEPFFHLISDIPQCAPCKWDDGLNLRSRHFKGSAVGMKTQTGRPQYPFALSLSKGPRAGHQGALGPQGDRENACSPNGAWSLPGRCINALKYLHLRR